MLIEELAIDLEDAQKLYALKRESCLALGNEFTDKNVRYIPLSTIYDRLPGNEELVKQFLSRIKSFKKNELISVLTAYFTLTEDRLIQFVQTQVGNNTKKMS